MVSPNLDFAVVQQKIDLLVVRDAQLGEIAQNRERAWQITSHGIVGDYEFPPNTSRVHVTDWVHRKWLRPMRFMFRNLPRPIRKLLKRLSS